MSFDSKQTPTAVVALVDTKSKIYKNDHEPLNDGMIHEQ